MAHKAQLILTIFSMLVLSAILFAISRLAEPEKMFSGTYLTQDGGFINDSNQYNHVANALLRGHAYLDLNVPRWLAHMKNPYDAGLRLYYGQSTGEQSYWDYAFFNGKYYSYFGVFPVIVAFIPFKLLTGHDLRTDYAVVAFAVLFVIGAFYFLYALLKKYFDKTSFGMYILSAITLVVGGSGFTQVFLPKIYSLPILASLTVTTFGLGLWLRSFRANARFTKAMLFFGALCIALNLLCRPQFILSAFLAFPIFWEQIKKRLFFSQRGVWNTLAVIAPFFCVGIPAMWYNKIRFESFFDFGATYNLTGFDMVHHSRTIMRAPSGLWMYLFQPLNISPNFPYIFTVDIPHGFMGTFIMEPYFGGFLVFTPIAFAILLAIPFKRVMHTQKNALLVSGCVVCAFLLLFLDSALVGVNSRYFGDFGWLLIVAAIIVIQNLLDQWSETETIPSSGVGAITYTVKAAWLRNFALCTFLWTVLLYSLNLLSQGRYYALISSNDTVYRAVESWSLAFQ
ncbi:hypothetical protein [Alloscardovia venturai]